MTLLSDDIILRPSMLKSDTVPTQNGGRMDITKQVVSGVKNNLFPDVSAAQRLSGFTRFRKVFLHINADNTTALNNVQVYLDKLTPADDYLLIQPATATGTEDDDADDTLMYGVGALAVDAAIAAESIAVDCEHGDYATLLPFRVGMLVRVSNIPVGGGAGTEEFVQLTAVSIVNDEATLTFTGTPLANAYLASNTIVSGVIEQATVAGAFNTLAVTSAAGTLSTIGVPNKGAIADTWTLTFSDATTFTAAGAVSGAVAGAGSISADYAANNPSTSTPYFRIPSAGWGGAFSAGDTVTFNTTPAALPLLVRNRIPADSGSMAGNSGAIAWKGESAD